MSIFKFLKSKSFFKQIAIAVIGFVILFFGLKFWLNITTNHDQKIQVPYLHKLTIKEAEGKLTALNLDFKVIDSASYNPEYPKKSVIEQSPEAGDFVKEKRKIYLTLNPSKYRDITIPDLNGRTKRQAISELQAIGFIVGTEFTYVKDIGKDVVRGLRHKDKILNPNDQLPKNAIIDLVLGDGNGN
jgi:beta-lactam-binding protein with PASTA domain